MHELEIVVCCDEGKGSLFLLLTLEKFIVRYVLFFSTFNTSFILSFANMILR